MLLAAISLGGSIRIKASLAQMAARMSEGQYSVLVLLAAISLGGSIGIKASLAQMAAGMREGQYSV